MFLSVSLVASTAHRRKLKHYLLQILLALQFRFSFLQDAAKNKPDPRWSGARLAASSKLHAPFNVNSSPVQWNSFIYRHAQAGYGELHPPSVHGNSYSHSPLLQLLMFNHTRLAWQISCTKNVSFSSYLLSVVSSLLTPISSQEALCRYLREDGGRIVLADFLFSWVIFSSQSRYCSHCHTGCTTLLPCTFGVFFCR